MKLRIYDTKKLDLDTVGIMLYQADKQANFHPESFWVLRSLDGEVNNYNQDDCTLTKRYKELHIKWIGREPVVTWLVSNQVIFEVISHDLLDEEIEALETLDQEKESLTEDVVIN